MALSSSAFANLSPNDPTWWQKYQFIQRNGPASFAGTAPVSSSSTNVDVSNECGPQSETFIAINTSHPRMIAGGSNEIFRLPMRGYFSTDSGASWGGVDLPLPPNPQGANSINFGSDPGLAFDGSGNLYYSYIVVFFGAGAGVNGTEMAVAHSTDGGKSYPQVTFFSYSSGGDHFNDKPMIAADSNPKTQSPFAGNVYVAWDAASGGSSGGGIRFGRSTDHGQTFTVSRIDAPTGPGRSIGTTVAVGPNGEVYVAWNDYVASQIVVNSSFDGGVTFGTPRVIANQSLGFQALIPAQSFRGALLCPTCDADRSAGPHRGRVSCAWMDTNIAGNTDIFLSFSDDGGSTWSAKREVTDGLGGVDRFNQWLPVAPLTGHTVVTFYGTRNDSTGARVAFDTYLASPTGRGATFAPNLRVSDVTSNEHDCSGVFPCASIDYGNQTGDYEGVAPYGGTAHPIWTDEPARHRHLRQPRPDGRGVQRGRDTLVPGSRRSPSGGQSRLGVLLAERPGADDAELVAEDHRNRHQRQVERVAGGRDDRRDDGVQHDGVAPVLGEELVIDEAHHSEEGEDQRHLEDDAERDEQHHDQAELLIHHQHRLHVGAGRADQELEGGRQDDEVGERGAPEEEERRRRDEWHDGAPLLAVEARRHERPDLPEDERQADEEAGVERHLEVDEKRVDAARVVQLLLAVWQRREHREHEEVEELLRPVPARAEAEREEEEGPLEPLAQLDQVVAEREVDVVLGPLPRRAGNGLRQRERAHAAGPGFFSRGTVSEGGGRGEGAAARGSAVESGSAGALAGAGAPAAVSDRGVEAGAATLASGASTLLGPATAANGLASDAGPLLSLQNAELTGSVLAPVWAPA